VPGLALPRLIRRLGNGEAEQMARAEAAARIQLAHSALRRIEEVAERDHLSDSAVAQLTALCESRIQRDLDLRSRGSAWGSRGACGLCLCLCAWCACPRSGQRRVRRGQGGRGSERVALVPTSW